ncbi:MAG: hypothetical protein KF712_11040 [Akkermansiaceae bacterium]|nr:hypothetical protein [Akkermansiaceae bacterium]
MLPQSLKTWWGRQVAPGPLPAEPMQVELGGARLSIRSATLGDDRFIILFQESDPHGKTRRLQTLGLSSREAEVLLWVSEGKSNDEIGTILGISSRTVAKHLEQIFRKINVETRVAAALRAKEICPG